MSYRDWVKGLATGFVVTLALIVGFGGAWLAYSWGVDETARYEMDARKQSEEYARHTYNPEREACSKLPDVNKRKCEANAENRAREQYRYEQDLVAQRKSALWTHIMGGAAIAGMVLSTFGIVLIYTTFKETRKTTQAARDSANAAVEANANALKAVRVAESANKITEDTSKRQLRAYMTVSGCNLQEIEEGFVITAEIRNSGQTPAFRVRHMSESFAEEYPLGGNKPHPIPPESHSTPVGAGDTMFCAQRLFTNDPAWSLKKVKAGEIGFWIQGTVDYDDCFGEKHTLKFRYVFGGRIANSGGLLLHADIDGNEAY